MFIVLIKITDVTINMVDNDVSLPHFLTVNNEKIVVINLHKVLDTHHNKGVNYIEMVVLVIIIIIDLKNEINQKIKVFFHINDL